MRLACLALFAVALASCVDTTREDALARATIEQLRHGDLIDLQRQIDPDSKVVVAQLAKLREMIGSEPARSIDLAAVSTITNGSTRTARLRYDLHLEHQRWMVSVATRTDALGLRVIGLHAQLVPEEESFSLQRAGAFRFLGLSCSFRSS